MSNQPLTILVILVTILFVTFGLKGFTRGYKGLEKSKTQIKVLLAHEQGAVGIIIVNNRISVGSVVKMNLGELSHRTDFKMLSSQKTQASIKRTGSFSWAISISKTLI